MSGLFLKIVNMSISAGWLILAVLLCRLLLRKAPRWVNLPLWGIVAVRAICPFSIESALSLIPSVETISPDIMMDASPAIHTGISSINSAVNPVISQSFAPSPGASANPLQIWIPLLAVVWVAGVAGFLVYAAVSYWRLCRKLTTAVLLRDNIFQSEHVSSPFLLGVIRPRIYLPFKMNGRDREHVIAHERAHIRRRDYWWKSLGFLLLAVHWFNPLMWLSYMLLCRDIELACDEKVIRELDNEQRADYTQALLACSVSRRVPAACPLAFGEVGVKERVKSVMNYKRPAFWVIVVAVAACAVLAVCFLTDPEPESADTEMIPTSANVQGAFDEYLYIPFGESGTYRYERTDVDPALVTVGDLLYRFTEKADPFDVEWKVYEVLESPDHRVVCAVAGDNKAWLYQYSPSKAVVPGTLEEVKKSDYVVEENGEGTYGAERWEEFYEATQNGKSARVKVAYYYTLDPEQCDEAYYEAHKEDYPSLHVADLGYDGEKFTLSWTDGSEWKQYRYLMKYEDAVPYSPAKARRAVTRYVLTNDDTATWNELFMSAASSQSGAYIDHFSIYTYVAPTLSLDDVITLSQKGYDLRWGDFEGFNHVDVGSGLYVWSFEIDNRFSLLIGGYSTRGEPMYVRLRANDGTDAYIDIRDGGVAEFVDLHK